MKTKTCLIIAVLAIIFACKKKEDNNPEPSPTPEPTPTIPETHYIPANYNDAHGILTVSNLITKTTTGSSSSVVSSQMGIAKFTLVPNNFTSMVGAGAVSVNSSVCTQYADSSYNNFNSFLMSTSNAAWQATGGANIPAFTFTSKTPTVTTGPGDIQVNKTAGFTFDFSNITNKDSVSIKIETSFSSTITASTIEKRYLYSAGSASFSPSELSGLPTGTLNMVVKCKKYAKDTVSGKYFYFVNNTQFTQNVIVN